MKYWYLEIRYHFTRMCRLYFQNYVMVKLSEKQMPMCILGRWYLKVWFSGVLIFTQKNMANKSYYSQFQTEKF